MAEQRLAVFLNRERVGTLWSTEGGTLCLAYLRSGTPPTWTSPRSS